MSEQEPIFETNQKNMRRDGVIELDSRIPGWGKIKIVVMPGEKGEPGQVLDVLYGPISEKTVPPEPVKQKKFSETRIILDP